MSKEVVNLTISADAVEVQLSVTASKFVLPMLMFVNDVEVECHFDFQKGYAGRTDGPPENCYPGESSQAEITQIVLLHAAVLTDGEDKPLTFNLPSGTDLCDYLSRNDIQKLEERLEELAVA